MPEAAEVEIASRQLGVLATGRRLVGVSVTHPRTSRAQPIASVSRLAGRDVSRVRRHGKWIVMEFDGDGPSLGIHLRMSGQLLARRPGDVPGDRHVHAVLDLGTDIVWFRDPRTFGEFRVLTDGPPGAADVLDPAVDARTLLRHAARRTVGVKAVLLDQRGPIVGVGSYLADEALHRAAISPITPASDLRITAWERILGALREVIPASVAAGGVTLADEGWVDLRGRPGRFADELRVHARERCATCGAATRSATVGGRRARWCPTCQPARRRR